MGLYKGLVSCVLATWALVGADFGEMAHGS